MNYAILLSGGSGTRVGLDVPKQYIKYDGYMMITKALDTIIRCNKVDSVYIVCEEEWQKAIEDNLDMVKIPVDKLNGYAVPGDNRQLSILNGMNAIIETRREASASDIQDDDTILIHDAARPFLSKKMLESCYDAIAEHDGVMPALTMKDTVYYSEDGGKVSKLLDRSKIFAGQAPELFLFKKYYDANISLLPDKINSINGSTEPAIMAGLDIAIIPGDESNYKVTTKADMDRYIEQS